MSSLTKLKKYCKATSNVFFNNKIFDDDKNFLCLWYISSVELKFYKLIKVLGFLVSFVQNLRFFFFEFQVFLTKIVKF